MHHATKLPILASLALALAACPGTTPNDYLETAAASTGSTGSTGPDDLTASTEGDANTSTGDAITTEADVDATGGGEGGGEGTDTGELSGSTGEPCPPCPGPTECADHKVPDGICEDVCDVLDLACEPCGLTPYDCALAHWLCSQGDDPCGVVADKGNDQAGHLCACAMACDPPAP